MIFGREKFISIREEMDKLDRGGENESLEVPAPSSSNASSKDDELMEFKGGGISAFAQLYRMTKELLGDEPYTRRLHKGINNYYGMGSTSYDFENDLRGLKSQLDEVNTVEEKTAVKKAWMEKYLNRA